MDIYAKKGHKVKVTKETANNGLKSCKEMVADYLTIGKIYTVEQTIVHSSSTDVELVEIPDIYFNSVCFVDVG